MADFTITVTDSIRFFGGEPPNLWGTLVWGTDGWAYGQPEVQQVNHLVDMGDVILSEDVTYSPSKALAGESITLTGALTLLTLRDAAGYYHVFLGNVTDSEERASTTWSSASDPSSSWSQVTQPTTTWSDA